MPRTQIIYDIFDAYLKCNNKSQKEQYANFVLAMYGNYGRYIRIPEFIFDKNELIDAYLKLNLYRLPVDVQELTVGISGKMRGFSRKMTAIKAVPGRNCIQFIDGIVNDFCDEIHRIVMDRYKQSLTFILSLDFEEVKILITPFLKPETEEEDDDDDEGVSSPTSRLGGEPQDEDREHYGKTLETVQKMLDNHIPKAIDREKIRETRKDAVLRSKITKEQREKEQFEKIQKKNELLAEQNRLLEERKRIKQEGKTECGCGGYFQLSNKVHHFKTKKHLNWEASQKEEIV